MSIYYDNLTKAVLDKSDSKDWMSASREWEIFDCVEDNTRSTICICGKEGLRYVFTIKNMLNGNLLSPIGSTCIKKFNDSELYDEASIWEKEFKLYHAVSTNSFINLKDSGLFSRKLLRKLYEEGAIKPTRYNNNDPYKDYQFLLDMFNKRNPSERQLSKCTAIILNSIIPFIKRKLKK
ncbi:MAG: hypothetical protein J6Y28_01460 [Acholeplasmatales bacterium]|nr:hypothetical protein [Acholeplasmatales bacterium]